MVGEIGLVEVAAVREFQLAHLSVRHVHAAHLNRNHARADLEAEVAVDLAAHRAHDGHFIANGFHIFQFVLDRLAGPLAASLHAGLARPNDDDVVSHVQKGMQNAPAQALSVSQQQHDGDQAPANAQHGQRRTRAIAHQRLPALRNEFFHVHGLLIP